MAEATKKYAIEERRRQVTKQLALGLTEQQIADSLQVGRATISRDITFLKKASQTFIYDLAKSDLGFYYRQCIDCIEEANRKAWQIFDRLQQSGKPTADKDSLLALKIIREINESRFNLFKEGPGLMQIKAMHDKLEELEQGIGSK